MDAPGWFAALVPVAAAGVVWTSLTSGYAAVAGGWSGGVERWIAAALVVAALLVFGGTLGSRADRGDRRWARAGGAGMVTLAAVAAPAASVDVRGAAVALSSIGLGLVIAGGVAELEDRVGGRGLAALGALVALGLACALGALVTLPGSGSRLVAAGLGVAFAVWPPSLPLQERVPEWPGVDRYVAWKHGARVWGDGRTWAVGLAVTAPLALVLMGAAAGPGAALGYVALAALTLGGWLGLFVRQLRQVTPFGAVRAVAVVVSAGGLVAWLLVNALLAA
ncbi:MAG: hypothetical protein DWQ36_22000 [Acidobacteria bacterium]|nr:MAG: hypothetical protein DWQ30_00540 [Acidobacteriota bacterium]REK00863.1 MAG: hypothetical protein DWQ36_22000 [Acidobacteriota bacterium]